jgi:hypothetical protein
MGSHDWGLGKGEKGKLTSLARLAVRPGLGEIHQTPANIRHVGVPNGEAEIR